MIFQSAPPPPFQARQDAQEVVRRQFKSKQVHRFRIQLDFDANGESEKASYELKGTTEPVPNSGDTFNFNFVVEHYELHAAERILKKKMVGAGKIPISATGLPNALMDSLSDTHFWYPLLSLYLPDEVKDGAFTVDQALGKQAELHAKGKLEDSSYEMDGTLDQGNLSIAKCHIRWRLAGDGWLSRADGEVTDSTGTIEFKVRSD